MELYVSGMTGGGTLGCSTECKFDTSGCYLINDGECEGDNGETLANSPTDCYVAPSCEADGTYSGSTTCNDDCSSVADDYASECHGLNLAESACFGVDATTGLSDEFVSCCTGSASVGSCPIVNGECSLSSSKWAKVFDYATDSSGDSTGLTIQDIPSSIVYNSGSYAVTGRVRGSASSNDRVSLLELTSAGAIDNYVSVSLGDDGTSSDLTVYFMVNDDSDDAYYIGGNYENHDLMTDEGQYLIPFVLKYYRDGSSEDYTRLLNYPRSVNSYFNDGVLSSDGNLVVIGNALNGDGSFIVEYDSDLYDQPTPLLVSDQISLWEAADSGTSYDSIDVADGGYVVTGKNLDDYSRFVIRTGLDGCAGACS
jgi:hypothetical protein